MNLHKWRFAICGHSPEESLGDILKNSCPEKFRNLGLTRTLLKRYSCTGASCEFLEMFQNSYFLENVWKAASGSPQWVMQVVKRTSNFIFHNTFTTQNLIQKHVGHQKKIELVLYKTCLIYSIIQLSSLWYRIKRYFPMKRKCTEKLTWMIVLQLNVGIYLRWTKWMCFLSTFTE